MGINNSRKKWISKKAQCHIQAAPPEPWRGGRQFWLQTGGSAGACIAGCHSWLLTVSSTEAVLTTGVCINICYETRYEDLLRNYKFT